MKLLINIFLLMLVLSGLTFGNSLKEPKSIAIDEKGFIYVLDGQGTWRYKLRKYKPNGDFVEILNSKMINLWLDEKDFDRLSQSEIKEKFAEVIKYLKSEPSSKDILAKVFYPDYITIGPEGFIYAIGADSSGKHGKVGVIDPDGGYTILAFGEFTREDKPYGLWNPRGIAVDNEGNIYIANQGPYCIKKFDKNGKFLKRWAPRGSGRGKFKSPTGIAIDKRDKSVYALDAFIPSGVLGTAGQPEQMRIQKFTKDGKFIKKWGERLGIAWNPFLVIPRIAGIPEIDVPTGIAVDSKGYVYVFEKGKRRINKYDSDGKLILQWGKSGTKEGEFNFTLSSEPVGMAIDKNDNIYIADTGNNRIQKFDSNGEFLMEIR